MEEIGVEAVVKGLQAFLGDMRKVNSALDGIRPTGTLLQQMFENVGNAVLGFGSSVQRVVETALGVMLRDAIEFVIGQFGDLIRSIVEAGNEFQLLKLRLTGLNLNETADGVKSFDQAMAEAVAMTQEEITWLQTLGSATPFDPAQIANTFTMARAFGFTSAEAKRLTVDILNYTAAMGLSNETLFLVIQNMGQMVQRGKITGTEIRDLARGSYLPLAEVLERIAKNMGITVKELTKRISTPEGIPAQEFVKAFEEMVEQEPRFIGAAGRLSRALVPAAANVKELFTSIFGLNVVTPIFDILGEKVAGLIDEFVTFNEQGDLVKTANWERLVAAANNLGFALGGVIRKLLAFLPGTENLAEGLIQAINGVAIWIHNNEGAIINFFVGIANAVNTYVIVPFQRISAWVVTNWPTITEFFQSLGDIISTVFGNLFGGAFAQGDFLGGILDGLKAFMEFVTANKDQIAAWATALIRIFVVVEVLLTAFNIFLGIVVAVVGAILGFVSAVTIAIPVITFLATPVTALIVALLGLGAGLALIAVWFATRWSEITNVTSNFVDGLIGLYRYFQTQLSAEPDYLNDWLTRVPANMRDTVAAVGKYLEDVRNRWNEGMGAIQARNQLLVDSITSDFGEIGRIFTNFPATIQILQNAFGQMVPSFETVIRKLRLGFSSFFNDVKAIDWGGLGQSIIQGISRGVTSAMGSLANAVVNAARRAYEAALRYLGIQSPSKLFEEVGGLTMEGFSQGVQKYANVASGAMTNAMQRVASPAISMPAIIQSVMAPGGGGTVNNNNNHSYNLTVNSGASSEPIIQDFNMLQSLSGG